MPSQLRDLIPADLVRDYARIIFEGDQFVRSHSGQKDPNKVGTRQTPGYAQSLYPDKTRGLPGVIGLVRRAIEDGQEKAGVPETNRVLFTEEYPDFKDKKEKIVFSVEESLPGAFEQGRPGEARVRNLQEVFREDKEDLEHPGYRIAIYGYDIDSIIRLTCFARTNKEANARVEWLQRLMREYTWFFRWQGIKRIFFKRRAADFVLEEQGEKLFARPLDYFVKTEEVSWRREKTIERIIVDTGLAPSTSVLAGNLR